MEVMLATAVLSMGAALIYGVYFTLLDLSEQSRFYFAASPFIEEKMWQVQDDLMRNGALVDTKTAGVFSTGGRSFPWSVSAEVADEAEEMTLYRVHMSLATPPCRGRSGIWRAGFASYNEKK